MVTYGFYAVFAALGTYNLVQGRPFVALFYAIALGFMIWFDRKMARDSKAHEERMAASAAEHARVMKQLDESTARYAAEAKAYRDSMYSGLIQVYKADLGPGPLNEEQIAKLRQELNVSVEAFLQNIVDRHR